MRVLSAEERIAAAPRPRRAHRHNAAARKITAHGLTMTVHQWHLATGIPMPSLFYRIRSGWPPEEVVNPNRRPGRRIVHYVEVGGERLTMQQLAVRCGIGYHAMVKRRLKGASPEEMAEPYRNNATYERNGETLTVREWAARAGLQPDALRYRLSAGWTLDEALATPLYTRRSKHGQE